MKQKTLPGFEFVPAKDNDTVDFRWYYITRNRDAEMLLTFDENGLPIWCPHDLQYTIPHVYSSAQTARRDLDRVGGHAVKMSRYVIINGSRVVRW